MPRVLSVADLPGSETAFRFEGRDYDATVSFFISRHPPGAGPSLHRHPYEETFIVERGSATFTVDGETIEARAGHVVVVPAGAAHCFISSGDGALRQISVHPSERVVQELLEE
jgi:quercetin dioxygenase-like cupin family protein